MATDKKPQDAASSSEEDSKDPRDDDSTEDESRDDSTEDTSREAGEDSEGTSSSGQADDAPEDPLDHATREGFATPSEGEDDGAAGDKEDPDDGEGWPRSWIVVTAILGIVAIIIVARLMGQSWQAREEGPPPPHKEGHHPKEGQPPGHDPDPNARKDPRGPKKPQDEKPGSRPHPEEKGHRGGPAAPAEEWHSMLDLRGLTVPKDKMSCVGKDKKFHKIVPAGENKKGPNGDPLQPVVPKECVFMIDFAPFKVEIMRDTPGAELVLQVVGVTGDEKTTHRVGTTLISSFLVPTPKKDERPIWFASNQSVGTLAIMIQNHGEKVSKFSSVKLSKKRR